MEYEDSLNLHQYALMNPELFADPHGLISIKDILDYLIPEDVATFSPSVPVGCIKPAEFHLRTKKYPYQSEMWFMPARELVRSIFGKLEIQNKVDIKVLRSGKSRTQCISSYSPIQKLFDGPHVSIDWNPPVSPYVIGNAKAISPNARISLNYRFTAYQNSGSIIGPPYDWGLEGNIGAGLEFVHRHYQEDGLPSCCCREIDFSASTKIKFEANVSRSVFLAAVPVLAYYAWELGPVFAENLSSIPEWVINLLVRP